MEIHSDERDLTELRMRREVLALRNALEDLRFQGEQRLAQLASSHRSEIEELQATIRRLREVLESERAAQTEALQALRASLSTENRQLQEAIAAARDAYEAARLDEAARQNEALLAATRVRAELESTIRELRTRIDEHG